MIALGTGSVKILRHVKAGGLRVVLWERYDLLNSRIQPQLQIGKFLISDYNDSVISCEPIV